MFRLLKTFSAFSSAYHVGRRISTNHHSTPSCSQISSYVTTSRPFSSTPTPPPPPPPGTTDSTLFERDSLKRAAAIIAPSVVNLTTTQGLFGSGVLFSEGGTIIACAHTVVDFDKYKDNPVYRAKRKEVMVTSNLGQKFSGTVADCDVDYDLALVKINSPVSFSPAKFGVSKHLAVGDWVLSVGNPQQYANTFSMGIISCVKRTQLELGVKGKCKDYLQTDCWLHEGSSGGALVNLEGEVIGLNCAHGDATVGVGFAIPIDTVLKVMKERKWLT